MTTQQLPFRDKHVAAVPVECLGQTFASDEARRKHFLGLLSEKLKDPEFRKMEGFPIRGVIITLSDCLDRRVAEIILLRWIRAYSTGLAPLLMVWNLLSHCRWS